jgi:hypothetical protein
LHPRHGNSGALGIGVTWGVAWAVIFAALSVVIGMFVPDSIDPGEGPRRIGAIGAVFGFVSGIAFGVTLALADGRKVLASFRSDVRRSGARSEPLRFRCLRPSTTACWSSCAQLALHWRPDLSRLRRRLS